MFVKKGLAATSVEDIAETAGYTRGAFYSNFHGKPELLLELVRRDHDSAQVDLRAVMDRGRHARGNEGARHRVLQPVFS